MRARIGDIVLYRDDVTGEEWPAVVTRVFSETAVNLTVFSDGEHPFGKRMVQRDETVEGYALGAWRPRSA